MSNRTVAIVMTEDALGELLSAWFNEENHVLGQFFDALDDATEEDTSNGTSEGYVIKALVRIDGDETDIEINCDEED